MKSKKRVLLASSVVPHKTSDLYFIGQIVLIVFVPYARFPSNTVDVCQQSRFKKWCKKKNPDAIHMQKWSMCH